jgi:hypothetical protein
LSAIAEATPPDSPIPAANYVSSINRGVVTEWAEFPSVISNYNSAWPKMVSNVEGSPSGNSFDHVRLRVSGGDPTYQDTWNKLTAPIDDSLSAGLYVIVAYKGYAYSEFEHTVVFHFHLFQFVCLLRWFVSPGG